MSSSLTRTKLACRMFPSCSLLFARCIAATSAMAFGSVSVPGQVIVPRTAVQIENTNASFIATDVDVPQANPARPTVTIPAHILPTGYLQFEQGFVQAGRSPAGVLGQNALTQTTKLALTTRLLAQSISQPYARSAYLRTGNPNSQSNDPGDLDVGVQVVAVKSAGIFPTASVSFIRRVRTGTSANLDLGDALNSALLLLGGDVPGGFHYDSNILFNEQNDERVRRGQFGQTLAVSHPIPGKALRQKLGSIIELSHFTQPLVLTSRNGSLVSHANALDFLFVATYTLHANVILDVSVDKGLTSTSTEWQGLVGFSYIFPHRLWPDRHPRVAR